MTHLPRCSLTDDALSQLVYVIKQTGLPIARGIEKEGLRVGPEGAISQTDHPQVLGHPLTHEHITTDYSEALLELITGVHADRDDLLAELESVHRFVQQNIGQEVLWSGSMPCQLAGDESIRIAEYGSSNIGKLKHVYRQGLGVRYGRIMQSIAGLHFNFSLSDEFWQGLQRASTDDLSLQDFKSAQYFGLIRNFRRYAWLLMFLFGASPVLDQSFLSNDQHDLEPFDNDGSYYKPYATSLRMGDLGYHNNAQSSLSICFNALNNFTSTLGKAIRTSYPPYEAIGIQRSDAYIQLNTNILQIENEYYSSIRPKRTAQSGERPTDALIDRGVEYVEVRCLDLNPFLPLGISETQIDFMDVFLLYCLLKESPFISDAECDEIDQNFASTVNEGRKPGFGLRRNSQEVLLSDWGQDLLGAMQPIARALDEVSGDDRYAQSLQAQQDKLNAPELTPSAEILAVMKQEGLTWLDFMRQLSEKHKAVMSEAVADYERFERLAASSIEKAAAIEAEDTLVFSEFLASYNASF